MVVEARRRRRLSLFVHVIGQLTRPNLFDKLLGYVESPSSGEAGGERFTPAAHPSCPLPTSSRPCVARVPCRSSDTVFGCAFGTDTVCARFMAWVHLL